MLMCLSSNLHYIIKLYFSDMRPSYEHTTRCQLESSQKSIVCSIDDFLALIRLVFNIISLASNKKLVIYFYSYGKNVMQAIIITMKILLNQIFSKVNLVIQQIEIFIFLSTYHKHIGLSSKNQYYHNIQQYLVVYVILNGCQ